MNDFLVILTSYSIFTLALFIFLGIRKEPHGRILLFFFLFSWYYFSSIYSTFYSSIIAPPPDSFNYFERGRAIAISAFDTGIILQQMKAGIGNLGWNTFSLWNGIVLFLGINDYFFALACNIFIATLAVYFSVITSEICWGKGITKYTLIGFIIYFEKN